MANTSFHAAFDNPVQLLPFPRQLFIWSISPVQLLPFWRQLFIWSLFHRCLLKASFCFQLARRTSKKQQYCLQLKPNIKSSLRGPPATFWRLCCYSAAFSAIIWSRFCCEAALHSSCRIHQDVSMVSDASRCHQPQVGICQRRRQHGFSPSHEICVPSPPAVPDEMRVLRRNVCSIEFP